MEKNKIYIREYETGKSLIDLTFVQSLIKESCHNSRTSNNCIDIKLGPVTKLDKKNTTTSDKFDDDVMLTKNADINKIKEVLVGKGILFETTYVCKLTYQISLTKFLAKF